MANTNRRATGITPGRRHRDTHLPSSRPEGSRQHPPSHSMGTPNHPPRCRRHPQPRCPCHTTKPSRASCRGTQRWQCQRPDVTRRGAGAPPCPPSRHRGGKRGQGCSGVPGGAAGSDRALPVMPAGTALPAAASPRRSRFLGGRVSVQPWPDCRDPLPPRSLSPRSPATTPPPQLAASPLCPPNLAGVALPASPILTGTGHGDTSVRGRPTAHKQGEGVPCHPAQGGGGAGWPRSAGSLPGRAGSARGAAVRSQPAVSSLLSAPDPGRPHTRGRSRARLPPFPPPPQGQPAPCRSGEVPPWQGHRARPPPRIPEASRP